MSAIGHQPDISQNFSESRFDVAIIGAGPAGLTAALALKKSGLKTVIIEKDFFPREKVCGDAVAAYVPKVLATIDDQYRNLFLAHAEKLPVRTCHVSSPDGSAIDLQYEEDGFIFERKKFDQLLMDWVKQTTSTKVLEGYEVKTIERMTDHFVITIRDGQQILTGFIIGCDGANGICAKQLTQQKVDYNHHSAAVRTYYSGVKGLRNDVFELHFLDGVSPGYLWVFPMTGGKANVGIGVPSDIVSKKKLNLRNLLEEALRSHPILKERFFDAKMESPIKGFGLPLGSRSVEMSGERFLLCGDAASLIDPISGEGIGQAMVSGRYAGWHAERCFQENNFSPDFTRLYEDQVHKKFRRSHMYRYKLRKLIESKPRFFSFVVRSASKSKWLQRLIGKMI